MTHYDTLNIAPDATPDEVRQAYRKQSMAAHPDKGGSDEAMAAINYAYAVLSDAERRARYDATGDDSKPTSLEDEARKTLLNIFSGGLDVERINLVTFAHQQLDEAIVEAERVRTIAERKLLKLAKHRKAISTKAGDNLAHMLIDQQHAQQQSVIEQFGRAVDIFHEARKVLADYEWAEEAPAPSTTTAARTGVYGLQWGML